MPKTAEQKDAIRQKVIDFCTSVTRGSSVIADHFSGEIVTNEVQLKRLQRKLMKVEEYALDTEFTSLRMQYKGEQELTGVSFSWGKYENYYVVVTSDVEPQHKQVGVHRFRKMMKKVFARKDVRVIGHNLKAEIHALANAGLELATDDLFDTLVAVWNIDENDSVGLKEITEKYYKYEQTHFEDILLTIPKEVKLEFGLKTTDKGHSGLVETRYIAPYGMDDTFWTWQIYLDIQDALEDEKIEKYFYNKQMPYLKVLTTMERRGVKVDFERLREMSRIAEKELAKMEYEIFELAGVEFNVGSAQHLAEILFGYKKQKPIYHIHFEPIIDKKTGEQAFYKSGARKGELKYKEIKDTNRIVGYEDAYNVHLVENSFNFPILSETKGGAPATGGDALEALALKNYKRDKRKAEGIKMVKQIVRYKKLAKLKSTYMEGLAEQVYSDGKIHASFNQTGTTSGRLSSSGPNLQNLPRALEAIGDAPPRSKFSSEEEYEKAYAGWQIEKDEYEFWRRFEIRDAFIPEDDSRVLIASDYSNLEMRVLTHFCQDPLLISMFSKDADVHGQTAVDMYKLNCTDKEAKKLYPHLRQHAKTLNFLLVYGGSAMALSSSLGVSKAEGQQLYDLYFDTYKGVKKFMTTQKRFAHEHEHVFTILGRKRHLEGINARDYGTVGYNERLAVNSPIQGSAADIAISAQLAIENDPVLKELGYVQLLQVHDEIVGSCPRENKEKVGERKKWLMENCLPKSLTNVKLKVDWDFGDSYAEAK